jgi:hypothetical protein
MFECTSSSAINELHQHQLIHSLDLTACLLLAFIYVAVRM